MEQIDFTLLGLLLFVASLVAMITRRLRLPYSVGLVAAGILLAFLPLGIGVALTPELVFTVLLPPLIARPSDPDTAAPLSAMIGAPVAPSCVAAASRITGPLIVGSAAPLTLIVAAPPPLA